MCGIAGYFNANSFEKSKLEKLIPNVLHALANRGPDGNGWCCIDGQYQVVEGIENNGFEMLKSEAFIGILVHTRLSIIDLSKAGHQPMHGESKQFWITYNGEVYNFQEIKKELIQLGWSFYSNSDTEVILKSYIQWGEECVKKFNGMFAFCIMNLKNKTLFCARDRIGIKPFYFMLNNEEFLFASDVTTLISSGLVTPKMNWNHIIAGYAFQGALRPNTVYENILALEPGYTMTIDLTTLKMQKAQYWNLPVGEKINLSFKDAQDALEEKIKKAIKRTLISDVEIATLMSGGIDSTTMSVMAALEHPNIKTFTLSFDESLNAENEIDNAKLVAKKWDMNHHITELSRAEMVADLDDMQMTFEEPVGVLEPHYPMAKSISKHGIKVLLNGLGPDEMLAGYGKYKWVQYWKRNRWQQYITPLLPNYWKFKQLKNLMKSNDIFETYYQLHHNKSAHKNGLFKTNNQLGNIGHMLSILNVQESDFIDEIQAASYMDFKVYIGTHHNHTTDRFLMRFGMEGRFPFLDHELVEFCFKLPKQYKLKHNLGKRLLREVAKKYIHPNCLSAKKMGFGIPEHHYMNNQLKQKVLERINKLKKRDFFKKEAITSIESNISNNLGVSRDALYLANFELWYQHFIERKGSN